MTYKWKHAHKWVDISPLWWVPRHEADKALAEAEARIKKLIEHHRLVCNEICGNCDDFECPARGRS